MDWFKLHDDLQNEIHRRFNAHLHFPFNYVTRGRRGGEFAMNTRKRCLFRLIELQPVECLFWLLVESSFFLHTPSARKPSVVFETALSSSLLLSSIFHFLFTNFGWRPFSEKVIQASLHLIRIINRLHDANEPLAKDIFRLCPDLPSKKSQVSSNSVKCAFFVLFDYAVSISFRTINWSR